MKKTVWIGVLGLIGLLVLSLESCKTKKDASAAKAEQIAVQMGDIKVATVDTDTLFSQYDMVADMTKEIEQTEKKLQNDLQNQAKAFQQEYENYLKVGASMTLSEQKKKEENLTRKKEGLDNLSARYADQMVRMRMQKTQEVQDKIFSFLEEYNKEHGNYTFIISKARTSGVLLSPDNIDITQNVLEAINAEYIKNKK